MGSLDGDASMVTGKDGRQYKDATELPGAIVINPELDPDLVYDSEKKRVTDLRTGKFFTSQRIESINGIYRGSIWDKSGKLLEQHEYRYGGSRLPDGEHKTVYEVLWSIRGDDDARLNEIGGYKVARKAARNDRLERLASFLRAQRIGYYNGIEKGEIVLVDRRTDDISGEMR